MNDRPTFAELHAAHQWRLAFAAFLGLLAAATFGMQLWQMTLPATMPTLAPSHVPSRHFGGSAYPHVHDGIVDPMVRT